VFSAGETGSPDIASYGVMMLVAIQAFACMAASSRLYG
jgi:hypothetical protein